MTINFDDVFSYILRYEGSQYVNDPDDSGGPTKYGITLKFYQNIKPTATESDIQNLSESEANDIYKKYIWDKGPYSKITSTQAAIYYFDFAINAGEFNATLHCQRACWAVSKDLALKDDGIIGSITLDQINYCGFMIMPAFRAERANFYRDIVLKNEKKRKFLNSWLRRAYQL